MIKWISFQVIRLMFSKTRQRQARWSSILLWIFTESTLHWLLKKVNSAHQKKISANAKFMVMWCEFPNTWVALLWLAVIRQSRVMSGLVCQKSINHTVEVKRVKDPGDFSLFKWGRLLTKLSDCLSLYLVLVDFHLLTKSCCFSFEKGGK